MAARAPEPKVVLSDDHMIARVVIPAGADPAKVTAENLLRLLDEWGVQTSSALEAKVDSIVATHQEDAAAIDVVVAEGRPPVHGQDGGVQFCEGYDPRETSAPEADADADDADADDDDADDGVTEAVDHYAAAHYLRVEPNEHVADLHERTDGESGMDVCGVPVKPRPGRKALFRVDTTTMRVLDSGKIVPREPGLLILKDSQLSVVKLLVVEENVDFSIGNIDFDGSVVVQGAVRDRFVVKVTEDLAVHGLIESATLIVGGDLRATQGFAARERGQMLVDGDCDAGYLNNVRGRVRGDLQVTREMMECQLAVGGSIRCARGAIVGGRIIATGSVEIGTLGSDGGIPTELTLGEVPFVSTKLFKLNRLIRELEIEASQLQAKIDPLMEIRGELTSRDRTRLGEMQREAKGLRARIKSASTVRDELIKEAKSHRHVELVVNQSIYQKTELRVRGHTYVFQDRVDGPMKITLDKSGDLIFTRPGSKTETPVYEIAKERHRAA